MIKSSTKNAACINILRRDDRTSLEHENAMLRVHPPAGVRTSCMAKIDMTQPDPLSWGSQTIVKWRFPGLVCVCVEVRRAKDKVGFFSNVTCNFCDLEDGPYILYNIQ